MRLILPILFLGLAVASFVLFTNPLWADVTKLREDKAAYDEALSSSKQFQVLRTELVARYNSFPRADLEKLSKMMPSSPDSIRLITQIERIAGDHRFVINNIKFDQPKEEGQERFVGETAATKRNFEVFNLEFSITGGGYPDFVALLNDLETSLRLIDFDSLTFSAVIAGKSTTAPKDVYNYSLKVRTYWQSS